MDRSDIPQPVVPDSPRQPAPRDPPKGLGPPHLRVVEVDFLKPTTRAEDARAAELDDTLPVGVLSEAHRPPNDDWE